MSKEISTEILLSIFLGLTLLALPAVRFDLQTVIPSPNFVYNTFFNNDLMNPQKTKIASSGSAGGGKDLFGWILADRMGQLSVTERVIVAFNADVSVLTGKSKSRVPAVNSGSVTVAPLPSSLLQQNLTATSSAFNARAEALGDLFMDETYLQSNLDLDEITAVAGHVTKEDLDVQRLVDVLWNQEVDLGANREWLEYSLRPPVPVPLQLQPNSGKDLEGVGKDVALSKEDNLLLPAFYQTNSIADASGFVDSETGEVVGRLTNDFPFPLTAAAAGNDSRDPAGPFNVTQPLDSLRPDSLVVPNPVDNGTRVETEAEADRRLDDRHLQSLIEALNSLNSSTMQAVQERNAVDERWEDVQSLVAQPNSPDSGLSSLFPLNNVSSGLFNMSQFSAGQMFAGANGRSDSLSRTLSTGSVNSNSNMNTTTSLNTFDFFSMFVDPPSNYTLPTALAMPTSPKTNISQFLTFPSGPGFNGSTVTRITSTQTPSYRQDLYGNLAGSNQLVGRQLVSHEGPLDLSAFPYLLADLQQPQQQVPLLTDAQTIFGGNYDWNITGDWNINAPTISSNPNIHQSSADLNDFGVPSQSGNDYLPAVNSSGNLLSLPNNLSVEWSSMAGPGPASSNTSEMLMMLDEAKLRLDKQQQVTEIKEEPEMEPALDPWTERATLVAASNHTYARSHRQKREGSEEDGESSSSWGSTGHGRSGWGTGSDGGQISGEGRRGRSSSVRTSRDDRAASEQRLPVTADEIVNMPVEEFNNYISTCGHGLSSDQIQLMKDIRRRGKNKVAAQNCRRRKIDNMSHLEKEIMALRQELQSATNHRNQLARQRDTLSSALRSFDSNHLPIPLVPPPTSLITTSKPKPTNAKRNDLHNNDPNDQSQRKRKRDH